MCVHIFVISPSRSYFTKLLLPVSAVRSIMERYLYSNKVNVFPVKHPRSISVRCVYIYEVTSFPFATPPLPRHHNDISRCHRETVPPPISFRRLTALTRGFYLTQKATDLLHAFLMGPRSRTSELVGLAFHTKRRRLYSTAHTHDIGGSRDGSSLDSRVWPRQAKNSSEGR